MLLALVIAIVSFAAFLRAERKTIYPLMDLNLFKIKIFSCGQLSALLNSIARGAVMILLILFFQDRGAMARSQPAYSPFLLQWDWSYPSSVSWVLRRCITIHLTGYLWYGCSSTVLVHDYSSLRIPVPSCRQ
jgi:hypothetical protein